MAQTEVLDPVETGQHVGPPPRFKPSAQGRLARFIVLAGLLALLLYVPYLVPEFQVQVVAQAGIFAIVALSMNMLMGYAGQVSLGHAAFYGIGAFISGVVVSDSGLPFVAGIIAAGVSGAVAAAVLGFVALRLRGLFLALVTIAYASLAELSIFKLSVFKGGAGVVAPRPDFLLGDRAYTYFVFGVLALALFIDWRIIGSKAGRAIQALRDDERVAASWGINVTAYKLLAFVISGTLAGIAGGLLAHRIGAVSSEEFRALSVSLTFVLMTVVGGLGNRWGVVIGGAFFAVLPTLLDKSHENFHFFPFNAIDAIWEPAIGAALLIITLVQFPGGIAQQLSPVLSWLQFGPFKVDHGDGGVAAAGGGESVRP